jgi:hypothetical protein
MTKTQLEQKFDLGNHNILELRISCAQLKITRIHDSKFKTNAKVWSNLISNLESKAKVITCGGIWYGGLILAVGNKNSQLKHQSPKIFPNFTSNSVAQLCTLLVFKSRSRLDWNMLEKFHFQRRVTQKNNGIETH